VLLITLDTLRPDALGWVAGKNATPALDRLAAGGLRFSAAVSPVPLTFPSHVALLTGVLPRRMGIHDNGQTLGPEPETLAQALHARGYSTAAFVSGYPLARSFGLGRGFDAYDDRFTAGEGESLERLAPETTAAALAWLASARAPWFLWVHYYDPHYPYGPPAAFVGPGGRGPYDGEVAFADHAIGQLLAAAESRAGEPLLTVFAGDHAESLGDHGEGTHGFFVYDATVLVPLVFRLPGAIAPGPGEGARLVDVAPTVLALAGVPPLPVSDGAALPRRNGEPLAAYVETYQPWLSYGWAPLRAVRSGRWKLIAAPRPELYDLAADPGEKENVFDGNRETARGLEAARRSFESLPRVARSDGTADAEAVAKLRSLGYVGAGGSVGEPPASGLRDPKDGGELREILTTADALLRSRRYSAAAAKFSEVLARDPTNRFALLRGGVALLEAGDAARAAALLARAVETSPEQPEARTALADALVRGGRPAEAVPHALEAARLQPQRPEAWARLGTALGRSGRLPDAVSAFERAVALAPGDPKLLARLAFAEHGAGRKADAVRDLERVAAAESDAFAYSGALGILLADLGRADAALPWLRRSRPGEGDFGSARLRLAQLEAERGNRNGARRALVEALSAMPELRDRARRDPRLSGLLP
jgi:arylsulfatase A-like enzyme/Flp pilus assembly protein TadD